MNRYTYKKIKNVIQSSDLGPEEILQKKGTRQVRVYFSIVKYIKKENTIQIILTANGDNGIGSRNDCNAFMTSCVVYFLL